MKAQTPEGAENKRSKAQRAPRHVMPGLIPAVARKFRAPRAYRLTPLAVQEDEKLNATVVQGSLFHDLYDRVEKLEREMLPLRRPAAVETTVREFRVLRRTA